MMTPWMRRISPKAVIAGAIVDIVATNVALAPVAVVIFARLARAGMTPAQQSAAFADAFTNSPSLYLVGMLLGCAASIVGGWTAAKLARRSELLNGALSAIGCVSLGVYGWIANPSSAPVWQHIAFVILSPALGAFGATIRTRQLRRVTASPSTEDSAPRPGAASSLRGFPRALYVANRTITAFLALGVLFFGLVGAYGYSQHQSSVILGSVFVCGFGLLGITLFYFAARMLRSGRAAHWALHASALMVIAIPILLLVVGLRSQHSAG